MIRSWDDLKGTYYSKGEYDKKKSMAMFDFDSTLDIKFGKGPNKRITTNFLNSISSLHNIIIISNQSSGIINNIKEYVDNLDELIGRISITVYIPTKRDRYRKPHTGVWEHYIENLCNGEIPKHAFYCGDAAGRTGDHSANDYNFAINIGVEFKTAERMFGGYDRPPVIAPFPEGVAEGILNVECKFQKPFIIIMTGSPASGKSFIASHILKKDPSIIRINRDMQGFNHTRIGITAIENQQSIIIDNTNPLISDRKKWADLVSYQQTSPYTIIVYHITTPKPLCFHLNSARCQMDHTGNTHEIPPVAINTYWKRLQVPSVEEANSYKGSLICLPFQFNNTTPPMELIQSRYN